MKLVWCHCIPVGETPFRPTVFYFYTLLTGAIIRSSKLFEEFFMQRAVVFSEDVVPLGNLKINPGRVVSQLDTTHRPVLLTNRRRGVAVIQSLRDYEAKAEELAFTQALLQGFADIEEGRTVSLADAKKRLGLV